jgi:ubiquitin C-terminal hydrolase
MKNTIDRFEEGGRGDQEHEGCTCPRCQKGRRSRWQMLVDAAPLLAIIVDIAQMII